MTPLETERLLIREFTEDDVAAFYQLGSDPVITRYTGDGGMKSLDDARQILRDRPLADYQKYGYGRWAIVLKSNNQVIGFTGLKYLEELKEVDIGYRLLHAYWGMGLATEASAPAIRYGFETLHLDAIIGLVIPENVASVRVLEKLGLTFVGTITNRGNQLAKFSIRAQRYRTMALPGRSASEE